MYPGALHTWFEHSLGVLHIANRIAEHLQRLDDEGPRIGLSDEEVVGIRLATLLRDVGHGPFSHVSEYLLDGT